MSVAAASPTASLAAALRQTLPAGRVRDGSPAVVFPQSADEAAVVLARARAEGWKVALAGGETWRGGAEAPPDLVLSAARMARVVTYEPADLTITVQAGMPITALAATVVAQRQWLPLDPPGHDASIGAVMATGIGGALAAAWGGPRDLATGLRAVTGDGRVFNAGGRVVKNVAGFDLVRPLVGSRGTLAFLAEITLRLFPLPDLDRTLVVRAARLEELVDAAVRAGAQPFMPAAIELLERRDPGTARTEALLAIRLVGGKERVDAEGHALRAALQGPTVEPLADAEAEAIRAEVRDLDRDAALSLRVSLPPSRLGETLALAREAGRMRDGHDELARSPVRIAMDAGSGALRLAVPNLRTESGWDERWAERLDDLRRSVSWRGGTLTLARAPADVMARIPSGDADPVQAELNRGLRALFDPAGTLSVDRFLLGVGAGDRG